MDIQLLLSVFSLILSVFSVVFVFFVLRQIHMVVKDFDRKVYEIHAENNLTDAFSSHNSHDISKLAQKIFFQVKQKYGITSANMTDLAVKLKVVDTIEKDLKHSLIDFFEKIVAFSYKDEAMSESEISQLKSEYKSIIRMLSRD